MLCHLIHYILMTTALLKGNASRETAKSHVSLLIQINYHNIVWNNVQKLHENRASSF